MKLILGIAIAASVALTSGCVTRVVSAPSGASGYGYGNYPNYSNYPSRSRGGYEGMDGYGEAGGYSQQRGRGSFSASEVNCKDDLTGSVSGGLPRDEVRLFMEHVTHIYCDLPTTELPSLPSWATLDKSWKPTVPGSYTTKSGITISWRKKSQG